MQRNYSLRDAHWLHITIGSVLLSVLGYVFTASILGSAAYFLTFYLLLAILLWHGRFLLALFTGAAGLIISLGPWSLGLIVPAFSLSPTSSAALAIIISTGALMLFALRTRQQGSLLVNWERSFQDRLHSQQKKAEQRLREQEEKSEENLLIALDAGQMGTWEWDILANKITWSQSLADLHGIPLEDFDGSFSAFLNDVAPEDRAYVSQSIHDALQGTQPHHIEYRLNLADGSERWVEGRGKVFFDSSGIAVRMMGVCMDISKRKRSEETRAQISAIVESSIDAIVTENRDGKILTWNKAAENLFGYKSEEAVGQAFCSLVIPSEYHSDVLSLCTAIYKGGQIECFETEGIKKAGSRLWISFSMSPVLNSNGDFIGHSKIIRDITESKRVFERENFLMEVTHILSTSLDYKTTLKSIAQILVPQIADWCAVDIKDENDVIKRLAIAHVDPKKVEWAKLLHEKYPQKADDSSGLPLVLRTGNGELYQEIDDQLLVVSASDEEHLSLLRKFGINSAMIVPLAVHGKTFGAITFVSAESKKKYSQADFRFAQEIGRRAALAIENARLFRDAQQAIARYELELRERNRVEQELRKTELIYQTIGESINYGIWIADAKGQNTFCSRSFLNLTGLSQKECSGLGWLSRTHPDQREDLTKEWLECIASGKMWDKELQVLGSDGNWHYLLSRGGPVRNHQQDIICWAGIALDISEMKASANDLQHAKELADAANAAKTAFLANMSHEIRTPLGAILGFSELMFDPEIDEVERREYMQIIQRNGQHLSTIINDILDLSRVEAGRLSIDKTSVSLAGFISDIETDLLNSAQVKGIELRFRTLGQLPSHIETDPCRLKQILNNIIGNAIKFTSQGYVDVLIEMKGSEKSGKFLHFEVKDTGCGLSQEEAAKLFKPFSQADVSTTRKFGGTGLGLSLSRHLARLLGGDVFLISGTPGKESVFGITIDPGRLQMCTVLEPSVSTHKLIGAAANNERKRLLGLKILVVDDSPHNQRFMSKFLMLEGAEVEIAGNGRMAIQLANTRDFHIILMDVQMPDMNGFEATSELRCKGYKAPIIALTAHAMNQDRKRCLESGFNDHLGKPVNFEELIDCIQRHQLDSELSWGRSDVVETSGHISFHGKNAP